MSDIDDEDLETMLTLCVVIFVLGGKGGIGKSIIAQILAATLKTERNCPVLVDTDFTNSSTKSTDRDNVSMLNLRDVGMRGVIANKLKLLEKGEHKHLLVDTGAQEDQLVIDALPWIAREVKKIGGNLLIVLPITLSSQNQRKAIQFVDLAEQNGIDVLYVVNHGQGRSAEHFKERWYNTKARRAALDRGAVEVDLPDIGAQWADEAAGFGLSLADAALSRFEKAGDYAAEAEAAFPPDARAWLNIVLSEVGARLIAGVLAAFRKRRELDERRSAIRRP